MAIMLLTILLIVGLSPGECHICGTDSGFALNIDRHVDRLMTLRRSDYGWINTPEVTLSLQLVKPRSFVAGNRTVALMETELRNGSSSLTAAQLAQYIFAIESMCQDSSNFASQDLRVLLRQKMEEALKSNDWTGRNEQYGFFLALGAYCVTHTEFPKKFHLNRILRTQGADGSFGSGSIDITSQAMVSLECLRRREFLLRHQRLKIERVLNNASTFLLSRITPVRNLVLIGNKYSTPLALLAVEEYSNWVTDTASCMMIMNSLRSMKLKDSESATAQRVLALSGKSYLSLLNDDYSCVSPNETPSDYSPNYVGQGRACANNTSLPRYFNNEVLIDVYITVRKDDNDIIPPLTTTVSDVIKGKTLLEILTVAQSRDLLTFETETTSWGEFLTTIDGVTANAKDHEYWSIENNEKTLGVGIGEFKPSYGNHITFVLKTW